MNALLPRIPSMGSDGRLLNTLTCAGGCSERDHVPCAKCAAPVCLGMLSDLQQARAKARPVVCGGCK